MCLQRSIFCVLHYNANSRKNVPYLYGRCITKLDNTWMPQIAKQINFLIHHFHKFISGQNVDGVWHINCLNHTLTSIAVFVQIYWSEKKKHVFMAKLRNVFFFAISKLVFTQKYHVLKRLFFCSHISPFFGVKLQVKLQLQTYKNTNK